jgi:hypothetical protein
MTEQHQAAPELWAAAEKWGANTMDMANCILELRDRIEALEAAQQPQQDKLDRLIALDRDDSTSSLVDWIATDAELCRVYNDALEHGFGPALRAVHDLGREDGAAPAQPGPESYPAGSLVDRVQQSIDDHPFGEEARSAILAVAAWLRAEMIDQGVITYGLDWATRLEQEANR